MLELYIVIGILLVFILFTVYRYFKQKKILKQLSEEEFRNGYRKAQLIDVREPNEFDGGHILGARNIPLTQMKQRLTELRKDKPVYLYCQNGSRSMRAALLLHKNGYQDLYNLSGGFKKWSGKIKKTKKMDY
ncbi:rhodanese-like domain-containing protein [Gracilibacillus dipsosauri]|uniref:Rhodanese-like domain-containing protein n=1 Tax=Gracilibacillus dipsosauri TaxID=178340 RepID=A0A317KYG8_9BACI|nr:rhodanese-like domain-containing protein [Gracilibacillus dipsosauri]PWU68537.1 rhodanese-like domain-containing protein [Gracilibacillus dipsosauri]